MSKLWVKLPPNNSTRVSTEGCEIIDDFIKVCKKELSHLLGSYDSAQLSLSLTESGIPLEPDSSLPESKNKTAKTPLFISITTNQVQNDVISMAILQIFAPRATKKFIEEKIIIKFGKIHVHSLLVAKRLKNLRFFDSKVLLQHGEDGWSILDDFENNKVYKLRYEPDDGFDESIGFSDAKLENVEKHFNLLITQDWLPEDDYPQLSIPDSLFDQLLLLHKRNTLSSENARRTIISLFLVNAVEVADEENKLHIHEEMDFACVRDSDGVRIQYKGPVDFAVGHSPVDSKLKKDCALLVVEAKTVAKLGDALGQTLAQAATNFIIRKRRSDLAAFLKVYWCISDGESWRFGFISDENGSQLKVSQSTMITCWLHQPQGKPNKGLCSQLFSKITHWIKKAMDSSSTTSRRPSLSQVNFSGVDDLNEVFISASIN